MHHMLSRFLGKTENSLRNFSKAIETQEFKHYVLSMSREHKQYFQKRIFVMGSYFNCK